MGPRPTDSFEDPKPPRRERKESYLRHLAGASKSVQLVAASDKLYNVRTILKDHRAQGDAVWSRFSGGREGVLWYYGSLPSAFSLVHPVVDELRRTVGEVEGIASVPAIG